MRETEPTADEPTTKWERAEYHRLHPTGPVTFTDRLLADLERAEAKLRNARMHAEMIVGDQEVDGG